MGLGVFDLTGGPFLTLYGVLLVTAIVAGFAIPRWLRPDGRSARLTNPDQIAYLAGGSLRYVDTVLARLLAAGKIAVEGRTQARIVAPPVLAAGPERSVLALPTPSPWPRVMKAVSGHAATVHDKLVDAGLLFDRGTALQLRFWQTAPYLMLIAFGAIKWDIGTERGRPVGFLSALLVITAVFALIRFVTIDRRTRAGIDALAAARDGADRLRRAPTDDEIPMAVALFGTTVLVGSAWNDYHAMRAASGSGDSGSGGSADGGGGGCGGGGCGGCGS
ncbi:MAG: TIGR04222 domain-containing membrane protein [Sphingomonas sp.]|uniref:TIGR04222 domain-containing membrane protein n=1 Tax=Sphingomonas sp. TaxID=28214 RepID=UPI0025E1EFE2|nr:TIGR04222 domain-containing membrane protein [Sphingomonas sp.]MBY0283680.1 TIGR04222 domain-containing membrane protein [Sphingomonas sp.]